MNGLDFLETNSPSVKGWQAQPDGVVFRQHKNAQSMSLLLKNTQFAVRERHDAPADLDQSIGGDVQIQMIRAVYGFGLSDFPCQWCALMQVRPCAQVRAGRAGAGVFYHCITKVEKVTRRHRVIFFVPQITIGMCGVHCAVA